MGSKTFVRFFFGPILVKKPTKQLLLFYSLFDFYFLFINIYGTMIPEKEKAEKKKELQKLLSEMDGTDVSDVLKDELDEETRRVVAGNTKKPAWQPRAWKPGQSGNPSGRPKNQFSFAKQFRNSFTMQADTLKTTNERAIELGVDPASITVGELFALSILSDSMTGRDSIAKEILQRIDGKIPDVVIAEIVPTGLSKLGDEALRKLAKNAMKEMDDETEEEQGK